MFDGDGFGLGLTVVALDGAAGPAAERRARWTEVLPPESRSRAGQAMELDRLQAEKARMFAYEAALVCGFAENASAADETVLTEPSGPDRPWAQREPAEVGEFFVDELAAALGTSVTAASYAWVRAQTLVRRLPGTWAALADGELDVPRGRAIVAEVARSPEAEPAVLMAVEAAVLPRARELTVTALTALVRAELVAHDAAFAERRRRWARDNADTAVRPDPDAPGRADLVVGLSVEDAHACWAAADRLARAAKAAGDPRPIGVLRAAAVRDRILGPDTDPDRPPVSAHVTVVAPLDALEQAPAAEAPVDGAGRSPATFAAFRPDEAGAVDPTGRRAPIGEVNGQPITATHLRNLLERLDALCPGGLRAPTGGTLQVALTDPDGALRALLGRRDLEQLVRRGCPDHPPGADCGCGLVDRPPPVDRYRPTPAQYRFVHTRDRKCRMPGCTTRAAWADLDHVVAHAAAAPPTATTCAACAAGITGSRPTPPAGPSS